MISLKPVSATLFNSVRHLSIKLPILSTNVDSKTGIATVVMQRPPINGLNLELLQAFCKSLDDLETDNCKGMVLTSACDNVFSGGLDIHEMYKPNTDRLLLYGMAVQDCWMKLFGSSFPTAAAITGHAPAGGCLLALACEYRVMTTGNYKMGLNETALGLVAPKWFQATMNNVISTRQTEIALTTGKMFSVNEALEIGLIDEIAFDQNETVEKCHAFLLKFNKVPRLARNTTKQMLRKPIIEALIETRKEDLKIMFDRITDHNTQKELGVFIDILKNKKKNAN